MIEITWKSYLTKSLKKKYIDRKLLSHNSLKYNAILLEMKDFCPKYSLFSLICTDTFYTELHEFRDTENLLSVHMGLVS